MPFTPFHVGPAIPVKAAMDKKFSLLVYAWAQIVMDLQPLIVILTRRGRTHGITHTFLGAAVLGAVAVVTGKYLGELILNLLSFGKRPKAIIPWRVAILSGFVGSFSHVLLDALVYSDMSPFWPFSNENLRIGFSSFEMILFCVVSGVAGLVAWGVIALVRKRKAQSETK
jgi:membrane-bound metal-dependent hydrolase YbcI (DUF457 family)